MKILVTGAAGFIGYHACQALLARGADIVGLDCLNDYYNPALKRARLDQLARHDRFCFEQLDLADAEGVAGLLGKFRPDRVAHLAAQAGVRYSLQNPHAYGQSNLIGHLNLLEAVRLAGGVPHLVYASSSSVYGERDDAPFSEDDRVDAPASLYAATKRAGELMSASYASLHGQAQTGLRFFTVYGPWGRPDMAYWIFAKAMMEGQPIRLFNNGEMIRDFTYIDDVVDTLVRVIEDAPAPASHRIFNIGGAHARPVNDLVDALERALGLKAERINLPRQAGDVLKTSADVSKIRAAYGFETRTSLTEGVQAFVDWYRGWREAPQSGDPASSAAVSAVRA